MALRKTIELKGNCIVYTPMGKINNGEQSVSFSAYIKVYKIEGDKNNIIAHVSFDGEECQFSNQYTVPVSVEQNSTNFIQQAYMYLKTLPEFDGAVDC